jgi:hypothetical protein
LEESDVGSVTENFKRGEVSQVFGYGRARGVVYLVEDWVGGRLEVFRHENPPYTTTDP